MSCSSRFLAKTSNKMQFAFWIELFEIQWNRAGSIGGSVGSNIPFLKMKLGLRGSSVCIMKPWLQNDPTIQVLSFDKGSGEISSKANTSIVVVASLVLVSFQFI